MTLEFVFLSVGFLGVFTLVLVAIFLWMKRVTPKLAEAIIRASEKSGDDLIIQPQLAVYRGSTKEYAAVKGPGVVAMTDKRVVFHQFMAEPIDIPLSDIESVSERDSFKGTYYKSQKHLIFQLRKGYLVAFVVDNHEQWLNTLSERIKVIQAA